MVLFKSRSLGRLMLALALLLVCSRPFAIPALSQEKVPLQKWVYCSKNLWVEHNIEELSGIFQRASKAGFTHILLADSKFGKLNEMDQRYFHNIGRVKKMAADLGLQIVPALFPIGYSN